MHRFFNIQIALITRYRACISLTADFHLILIFNIWHKSCKLILITLFSLFPVWPVDMYKALFWSKSSDNDCSILPSESFISWCNLLFKESTSVSCCFSPADSIFWIFLVLRCLIKCDMNLNETAWLKKDYIWLYLSWVYLMACKGRTCRCS